MKGNKTYRDNWGTPDTVLNVVGAVHWEEPKQGRILDVTRPAASGLEFVDLGLDFGAPCCGHNRADYSSLAPDDSLFCNPPGDLRGRHVRNAVDWAAIVHIEQGRTVFVALYNESVIYRCKTYSLDWKLGHDPNGRLLSGGVFGAFRKRVRWIDPETGEPGRNPVHHGGLLVMTRWRKRAEREMTSRGMLACWINVETEGVQR